MTKTCWVYVLASDSRKLYVGVTSDLTRRVSEHKIAESPDSFAAKYRIYKLVYFEVFDSPEAAIAREKQIKSYRREKKIALIEKNNLEWLDLYPDAVSGLVKREQFATPTRFLLPLVVRNDTIDYLWSWNCLSARSRDHAG